MTDDSSGPSSLPQLRVGSTSEAVAAISKLRRIAHEGKICVVTGSVGKSSSSALIHHVASGSRDFAKLRPSANYFDGVVGQLAQLDRTQSAVLEVSMAALPRASWILQPDVALLTSVAPAHLEKRRTLRTIAARKAQIFSGLKKGGTAIINRDIPFFDLVYDLAKCHAATTVTFGSHAKADVRLLNYNLSERLVRALIRDKYVEYELGMLGEHMAINSLGALAVLCAMGFDLREATSQLSSSVVPAGRGRLYKATIAGKTIEIIEDCYNASPASMHAGLKLLAEHATGGRRIAVLADMYELGPEGPNFHIALRSRLLSSGIDKVFLVGTLMGHLWPHVPENLRGGRVGAAHRLLPLLRNVIADGDIVMFKGSHGTGLRAVVESLLRSSGHCEDQLPGTRIQQ